MTKSFAANPTKGLSVVRAHGDFRLHLATLPHGPHMQSLCGQNVRARPPHKSFREAGCADCVTAAVDAGHLAVLEGDRSWINLRRLQFAPS